MKKHISIILIMTLLLTALFSFGSVALAASELSVDPKTDEMASGGDVEFDYFVYNESDQTIEGSIVCTTTGQSVVNLVSVGPNGTSEDSFTMNVSTELLGKDLKFSFKDGALTTTTKIKKKELVTKLAASGTVPRTLYGEGETVKFEYKIENQGETTIDGIVVKSPQLKNGNALNEPFSLAPGNSQTVKYSHTMTGNITVNATVSYSVGGAAQTPINVEPAITLTKVIRDVKSELTVSNDKPEAGEEVTFTLTLVNDGNVPYTDIQVLVNGEEKDFPSKLEANGTVSGEFKMSFQTSTDVSCSISLDDHTGETRHTNSNTVSINLPVDPNAVENKLQFTMNVDRPQLTSAGSINFTGLITNGADYELTNVKVDEATLGNIFSANSLAAGGKANVPFSTDINETTTYSFVLTATDKDGNTYTVSHEPITVTIQSAAPEATPGFEDAADVTETPLTLDNNVSLGSIGTLGIIAIVLVVLIIGVGVALLVLWKKGQSPRKSTTPPGRKKPASSYTRKKKPAQKNYRDRNNF